MYYGNYKNWGRNSQNKVASCVCCPNAFIKHLPLEGISKVLLVRGYYQQQFL